MKIPTHNQSLGMDPISVFVRGQAWDPPSLNCDFAREAAHSVSVMETSEEIAPPTPDAGCRRRHLPSLS